MKHNFIEIIHKELEEDVKISKMSREKPYRFIQALETHLSLVSKPWRKLRNEVIQHEPYEVSIQAFREELSQILHQYLRYNASGAAIIHEIISLCLQNNMKCISGLKFCLNHIWTMKFRYNAWVSCYFYYQMAFAMSNITIKKNCYSRINSNVEIFEK